MRAVKPGDSASNTYIEDGRQSDGQVFWDTRETIFIDYSDKGKIMHGCTLVQFRWRK